MIWASFTLWPVLSELFVPAPADIRYCRCPKSLPCNAYINPVANCWKDDVASHPLISGHPWTVRNLNISVTSLKRPKNRSQRFWVFPWRRSAAMSRDHGLFPCMLSGSFFFWSQGWPWKIKEKKYAGRPLNAQKNSGKNVRRGSSRLEIFAGLLTGPSVKASHKKPGVIRWKFVVPVRYLCIFVQSRIRPCLSRIFYNIQL